jgi:hypothetical protein
MATAADPVERHHIHSQKMAHVMAHAAATACAHSSSSGVDSDDSGDDEQDADADGGGTGRGGRIGDGGIGGIGGIGDELAMSHGLLGEEEEDALEKTIVDFFDWICDNIASIGSAAAGSAAGSASSARLASASNSRAARVRAVERGVDATIAEVWRPAKRGMDRNLRVGG